jgi:hypothetical protein
MAPPPMAHRSTDHKLASEELVTVDEKLCSDYGSSCSAQVYSPSALAGVGRPDRPNKLPAAVSSVAIAAI